MGSQLRLRFEQEAKLLKKAIAQVARRDQRIQAREKDIKNLEALLEAEADMKEVAEAKNAKLAQVTGEERIKATFEEFKKYLLVQRLNGPLIQASCKLGFVSVETTTSNALVSYDGSGYDWSDQAEEGPTNFVLMAYTSTNSNSEVSTNSNCSSSCLENVKILKEQNEQLLKELRTSKLNDIAYKTGLESVEARLLVYKKNKFVYEEDIKVLKCEIHLREVAITKLRRKLELAQKQKDEIQLTVEKFENSSKSLSKLIDCWIFDKCKIEEFVNERIVSEPTVKKPIVETSEAKASTDKPKVVRKNFGPPLIEDWISDSEDEAESKPKIEKKTVKPSFAKIEFVKSKEQVKSPRKTTVKQGQSTTIFVGESSD
ncbi:hypothetical protein Tco_1256906 [Tanacetum coccineum]